MSLFKRSIRYVSDRRRRTFCLLVAVQLLILAGDFEKKFWPFLNYTMFSKRDVILSQPIYELHANAADGRDISWDEIKDILAPIPSKWAFSSIANSTSHSRICQFLKSALEKDSTVSEFAVFKKPSFREESVESYRVQRQSVCQEAL